MRRSLRSILFGLGCVLLIASLPWQIALSVIEASSLQIHLDSQLARSTMAEALLTNLPQAFFDMAAGGVLMMLCRIDEKLEIRA